MFLEGGRLKSRRTQATADRLRSTSNGDTLPNGSCVFPFGGSSDFFGKGLFIHYHPKKEEVIVVANTG